MTSELHVVLGATGGIGSAVVSALAESGMTLRAVNRTGSAKVPQGSSAQAADVSNPAGAMAAVAGADVVYHCAQPEYTRWGTELLPMTATIADACEAVGAKLVLADNLYMYAPVSGPISETTPTRPASKKGQLRLAMANELLDRNREGRLQLAIGRASDYFGPGGEDSTPGALVYKPLAKGRKPRWLGRLDALHTLNYLPDVGRALVALGTSDQPGDPVWILPAGDPLTGAQWLAAVGEAAGRPTRPAVISPFMNRMAGLFVPMVRELNEIIYQFTQPFVVDDSRFRAAFPQVPVTPLPEAVQATTDWFLATQGESGAASGRSLA